LSVRSDSYSSAFAVPLAFAAFASMSAGVRGSDPACEVRMASDMILSPVNPVTRLGVLGVPRRSRSGAEAAAVRVDTPHHTARRRAGPHPLIAHSNVLLRLVEQGQVSSAGPPRPQSPAGVVMAPAPSPTP